MVKRTTGYPQAAWEGQGCIRAWDTNGVRKANAARCPSWLISVHGFPSLLPHTTFFHIAADMTLSSHISGGSARPHVSILNSKIPGKIHWDRYSSQTEHRGAGPVWRPPPGGSPETGLEGAFPRLSYPWPKKPQLSKLSLDVYGLLGNIACGNTRRIMKYRS